MKASVRLVVLYLMMTAILGLVSLFSGCAKAKLKTARPVVAVRAFAAAPAVARAAGIQIAGHY